MSALLAESLVRDIPDFPKPGIVFKDITPVLQNPAAFRESVEKMMVWVKESKADVIVGIESRGFIFGTPIAYELGLPFAMTRKQGKLPYDRISVNYNLEYGSNTVEMHRDAIQPGQRAYIVDDLLATGGTAAASIQLVESLGGQVVGFGCLIELSFLKGREHLSGTSVESLISY